MLVFNRFSCFFWGFFIVTINSILVFVFATGFCFLFLLLGFVVDNSFWFGLTFCFLQAEVAGGKPLRTKKVTLTGARHRLNPEWRSELWQPVTVPCMSGSIKVTLPSPLLFSPPVCVLFFGLAFFFLPGVIYLVLVVVLVMVLLAGWCWCYWRGGVGVGSSAAAPAPAAATTVSWSLCRSFVHTVAIDLGCGLGVDTSQGRALYVDRRLYRR